METVCKNVVVEPELLPTSRDDVGGNTAEKARLDIAAVGLWSPCEKSYFDVRITHPNAESQVKKSIKEILLDHEKQKKNSYNDRVIHVERGSFTPLVFLTTGGMGNECDRVNKRLADLIARKKGERYADVVTHIRTRLRFALLRATIISLRGVRGRQNVEGERKLDELDFNLINC